jgi:hypothetical protein
MTISDIALQGIQRAESNLDRLAHNVAAKTASNDQVTDSIDFSDVAIRLIQDRNEVHVNIKTLQTADEMTKTILDILA